MFGFRRLGKAWRRTALVPRLVFIALVPTTLTALLLVMLMTHRQMLTISELSHSTAEAIAAQTAVIAAEPLANGNRREIYRIARAASRLPNVTRVGLSLPDGEFLADLRAVPPDGSKPASSLLIQHRMLDGQGHFIGTLWLELSQQKAMHMQRVGVLLALTWLVVALLLAALLSWREACWIGRPLRELAHAMAALGHGGRDVQVAVTDETEIGNLQRGFNASSTALLGMQRELQQRIEAATEALSRKNAELEAASVAKARFLAAATHDLRQPLYALTLISSALTVDESDPPQVDRVARIQECVGSLDSLFSELLDLSRLESGSMQPEWREFPLDEVFEQVSRNFRMVAEQRDLRLVVRKTHLLVRSDPTMLARILGNLVNNALNYTERGGVLVGARRRGARVRIDVWDTGIGIAPEHQQHVFEDFFRACPQQPYRSRSGHGLGLGLSTVRKLAELLGTRVVLSSRPGRGSLFSLEIPLASRADRSALPRLDAETPLDVSGMRVLVVDDDTAILSAVAHLLGNWGCEVRTAEDREHSLQQAAEWGEVPDIVISDLRLRNGNNGLEVLNALDQFYGSHDGKPTFARLLITGETRPDRLREVVAARIPVLYKPVSPRQLREAIVACCATQHRAVS